MAQRRAQFSLKTLFVAILGTALLLGAVQAGDHPVCFLWLIGAGTVLGAAIGMPHGEGENFAAYGCAVGVLACVGKMIWILQQLAGFGPGVVD
jgi:hypothetical protein